MENKETSPSLPERFSVPVEALEELVSKHLEAIESNIQIKSIYNPPILFGEKLAAEASTGISIYHIGKFAEWTSKEGYVFVNNGEFSFWQHPFYSNLTTPQLIDLYFQSTNK